MPKFKFENPNGPEAVPALGGLVVNPGDVVDFPDEFVDGLAPSKWQPVGPAANSDDGGNASGT